MFFRNYYLTNFASRLKKKPKNKLLMIAVGVGTAVGLNALLSRKIGQHKAEEACQAATTGLLLMLITADTLCFVKI